MYGLLLLTAFAVWIIWYRPTEPALTGDISQRFSGKLDKLWDIAQESLRDHKYLRAEKALLTILRVDERNATAYNRLGILYAKQQAYDDAIECFEIAQSLEPSASSLHNVGLIYYETEAYDKASQAFEQALAIEEGIAARHIAYAKVQEKLGHAKRVITSLERAVSLEPSLQSYNLLADAYERHGRLEEATNLRAKLDKVVSRANTPKRVAKQKRRTKVQ